MKIPENVDEWDLGTITNILHENYYESNILELKESITTDNELAKTVCSFTNTDGGIIIFGVKDNRKIKTMDRMIGLDTSQDNATLISRQLTTIIPQIPKDFIKYKKTSIDLGGGKEIIVLEIKQSNYLHQTHDKFYQRLQGENKPMPYEQIRLKFIENMKNRLILRIFELELSMTRDNMEKTKEYESVTSILLDLISSMENHALHHFLFNQSYLYGEDVTGACVELDETISKMILLRSRYEVDNEKYLKKDEVVLMAIKDVGCTSYEEYFLKYAHKYAERGISNIREIEKITNMDIPKPNSQKYAIINSEKSTEPKVQEKE